MAVGLVSAWTYYLLDVTTGLVRAEVPMRSVVATRHLKLGSFSAQIPLPWVAMGQTGSTADLIARNRGQLRDLIALSQPWKNSVVIDRDGVPLGEWVIKGNPPSQDGRTRMLVGSEFGALLSRVPLVELTDRAWSGVDQFTIARAMVQFALVSPSGAGSTAYLAESNLSGQPRDRSYYVGETAKVLDRLNEMSDVEGGFDWWFDYRWDETGGQRYLRRTFRVATQAGSEQEMVLEDPGAGGVGGNILSSRLSYDGEDLASEVIAVGSGEGVSKLMERATNPALVDEGWPRMVKTISHVSVTRRDTLAGHAVGELAASQSAEMPPRVTILADGDPRFGDYALGDRMWLRLDPTWESPDARLQRVRVIGWSVPRPEDPGPEKVTVELVPA